MNRPDLPIRFAIGIVVLYLLAEGLMGATARAEVSEVGGYNVERLANAIYWAEGGPNTRHPYGILAKYKTTTPRQACINTIRSKHREWVKLGSKGDYIAYLQSRYAPIGAYNDPTGLNRNWLKNVRKLYQTS